MTFSKRVVKQSITEGGRKRVRTLLQVVVKQSEDLCSWSLNSQNIIAAGRLIEHHCRWSLNSQTIIAGGR